ncbi:MAG: trypsin-like peptidase domain-containing protein [Planctomycetes bacterium]|nr:trypsin-like peptidase domain-containing protein [Planctomycetota bacterium]
MFRSLPPPLFLLALTLPLATAVAQEPAPVPGTRAAAPSGFIAVCKKVLPSVVTVRTFVRVDAAAADAAAAGGKQPAGSQPVAGWVVDTSAERDYPGFRPHRSASGFFVSDDGDVLTTLGAIRAAGDRDADVVEIETIDGQRVLAEVVGVEPTLQLAVLRCAVFPSWTKPAMRPVTFGDSEALDVGSTVLAIADPAGPERFVAAGLLAAKPSRDCYQELMSSTYMQATIAVPPGAFGGPLVDERGDVVGILSPLGTGAAPDTGCAWALPSKIVAGLHTAIRAAGTTKSPWLGFSVMSRAEIATARGFQAFQAMKKPAHGILLENVFAPSPAAAAGLQPGDFLTHFAGVEIHQPVEFQKQLYLAGVGREIEVVVFRDGTTFAKKLVIEARPPEATPR